MTKHGWGYFLPRNKEMIKKLYCKTITNKKPVQTNDIGAAYSLGLRGQKL